HFSLIIFITAEAGAQPSVKVMVELNPGGSFVAQSNSVQGSVIRSTNNSYFAKDIKLALDTLKSGIDLRDSHMKNKYFEIGKFPIASLLQGTASGGKFTGQLSI